MQSVPLLEAGELVLSANDTYILMSCLELLEAELLTQVNNLLCSVVQNCGDDVAYCDMF